MRDSKGSAIIYIFASVGLLALLIFAATKGTVQQSPKALEVARITSQWREILETVRAEVQECILTYPNMVDADGDGVDDNANAYPPFPTPFYTADPFNDMICPGAPSAQQAMFTGKNGRFAPTIPSYVSLYLWNNGSFIGADNVAMLFQHDGTRPEVSEAWQALANGCDITYVTTGGCDATNSCLVITFYKTTPLC